MGTREGVRETCERDMVDGVDGNGGFSFVNIETSILQDVFGVLHMDGLE